MSTRAAVRTHLLVLVGFAVVALALSYPAFFDPREATPGNGYDSPMFLWNEWWVDYALGHGRPLLWTDRIYAPSGVSLVWHTHTVLNGLIVWPLSRLLGLIAAHNLLILASFVVSGYGTFLVARREPGVGIVPAFVAGVVFSFCPKKMVHLLEHPNLTSTQYLPLFVWAVLCAVDAPKRSDAVRMGALASLFLAASLYTEYTFAFFSALWFGVFLVSRLVEQRLGSERAPWLVVTTITVAVVGALLAMPLILQMARDAARGERPALHNLGAAAFAGDLKGFFLPSWLNPILGKWGYGATQMEAATTLGLTPLVLGAIGGRRVWRDRRVLWAVTFIVFLVFSFGSTLTWEGRDLGITLPYRLLAKLPILRTARAPSRFIFVAALALGVLVAIGLSELGRHLRSVGRRVAALGAALSLVLFEYLAAPFPRVKAPRSSVFALLSREPGDAALLEVPLGWRDAFIRVGEEDASLGAAQTQHERRRIGGIIARADPRHVQALQRLPLVPKLLEVQKSQAKLEQAIALVGERDHREACELARLVPVGNVLVSRHWRGGIADRYVRDAMPLDLIAEADGYSAYRVAPKRCEDLAALPYVVAVGDPSLRLTGGWSYVEGTPDASAFATTWVWNDGHGELVLKVPGDRPRTVRLFGMVPEKLVEDRARLRVLADDGVVHDDVLLTHGIVEIGGPVGAGPHDVTIVIETSEVLEVEGRKLGFALKAIKWN